MPLQLRFGGGCSGTAASMQQMNAISDHLYISGSMAIRDSVLKANKISCVISAQLEELRSVYLPLDVELLRVPIDDCPTAPIERYFDLCADKILSVKGMCVVRRGTTDIPGSPPRIT